ncbi:MAG TPA: stage II sporulation protein M [Armatimonadota bacterium]|jgi:uncharacterized membrane protein SpoIIM required for sporulation
MVSGDLELGRWERLATLLRQVEAAGLPALPVRELEELDRLYRQAAAALARERTRGRDPEMLEYLNALVARGHSLVYARRHESRLRLGYLFAVEIPRTCRARLDALGLAAALLVVFSAIAFTLVRHDDQWAATLSPGAAQAATAFVESQEPAGEYFAKSARQIGGGNLSGFILSNNVRAALTAFALGLTLGLGTIAVLFTNGLMLGTFLGIGASRGALVSVLAVVAPHGILELSAFTLAAAAGLVLGAALAVPGDLTRAESLIKGAREAVRMALGAVPLLLVCALVEGLLSPQYTGTFASNPARIAFGVGLAVLGLVYLLLGDILIGPLLRPARGGGSGS